MRNAALTAPYMHHGSFKTLRRVIAFCDLGGGAGAGARLANQTLSATPLHLTPAEQSDLEQFIRSLTDTVVSRLAQGRLRNLK